MACNLPAAKRQRVSLEAEATEQVALSDLDDLLRSDCASFLDVDDLCVVRVCTQSWNLLGADRLRYACRCLACLLPICFVDEFRRPSDRPGPVEFKLADGAALGLRSGTCRHLWLGAEYHAARPEEYAVGAGFHRAGGCGRVAPRMRRLTCGRCRRVLGAEVNSLGRDSLPTSPELAAAAAAVLGTYLVLPYVQLPAMALMAGRALPASLQAAARRPSTPLLCSGLGRPEGEGPCGNPLSNARAILSKRHRWNAGRGGEPAWYINHFLPDSVTARNPRLERLAQGKIVVADVFCSKCDAQLGWRFVEDGEHDKPNANQVGRFGIVVSAIQNCGDEVGDSGSESDVPNELLLHIMRRLGRGPGSVTGDSDRATRDLFSIAPSSVGNATSAPSDDEASVAASVATSAAVPGVWSDQWL